MKLLFHGKTALISGAGTGLGRVYALELSKRGANIVVNDLPPSNTTIEAPAESLVKYITANGGKASLSYHDVIQGEAIVADAIKAYGSIDILINNAGILRDKSFHKLPKEDWYKVINIHLNGSFELSHSVWPYMQEKNYGRIINVSSAAGIYGNFGQSNYSAAKMGIIGLTNTLAIEGQKHNILVNCVIPVAASKMTETVLPPNILERLKPEHISPMVTYLSHEECKESGNIYELGAGWYSQLRWQRSMGVSLGSDSNIATAEAIQSHLKQISNFNDATYPKTIAGSLGDMLEATSRPLPTSYEANETSNPPTNTSNTHSTSTNMKTDKLFEKVASMLQAHPDK
jgi:(3R)-3-hydroxyacyl-CoA dehydrogenase / 3a,7a,12a-trihydroxy-5b-cholest-24-enoyl-CoA hydratase / enoyl-CoA hydratase 2